MAGNRRRIADQFAQAVLRRAAQVVGGADAVGTQQAVGHRGGDVLDPHRLEAGVGAGQRKEGRDRRHSGEQGEEGVAAAKDHRGAE
jgi:hypothetical protein